MRPLLLALALALAGLPFGSGAASAHPLGNFTVNRLSHVAVAADAIRVRYVLDLAEIPTLQERQAGRIDGIAERLAAELTLRLDGQPVPLALRAAAVDQLPGQAGLGTLRVTLDLTTTVAPADGARLEYRDATYAGRIGWHAVLVSGVVRDASVGAGDPTDELRSYPADPSVAPPDISAATATVDLTAGASGGADRSAASTARFGLDAGVDALTAFLRSDRVELGALLAALVVATVLGGLHALGPGHGKAMVAAYLVGARGTAAQALILGGTVTLTHTIGVYVLGAFTLVAAQYVLPERLYPVLGVLSGVLVVAIGLGLLRARWRAARIDAAREAAQHVGPHVHGDGPSQHRHDAPVGPRGLLALGVSGGLLPCPTALVVLLAAVSFHNVALGMLLVAAFSVGLAAVLTACGLAVVWGGRLIARNAALARARGSAVARMLPALSAAAITVAGAIIAITAARGFA